MPAEDSVIGAEDYCKDRLWLDTEGNMTMEAGDTEAMFESALLGPAVTVAAAWTARVAPIAAPATGLSGGAEGQSTTNMEDEGVTAAAEEEVASVA